MISLDGFLACLMVVSTLTGLVTEAIKTILNERNTQYHANTLAGIVAAVLSVGIGIGYVILSGVNFNARVVVCIIALTFVGWLCAMVGYDKVISSLKNNKKD